MGLKDLRLPTETVQFAGGEFAVRGLSFVDISALARDFGPELNALYRHFENLVEGGGEGVSDEGMTIEGGLMEVGARALGTAPKLVSMIIAMSCEETAALEPEDLKVVGQLPVAIQLDALDKIGRLTFEMEGGSKKVLEIVVNLLRGAQGLFGEMRTSKAGSLASAAE
ncbi:phage pre-tape measure protein [Amorphus orientalis]|uniref:Tail protein n=1 Tax=Amorphus orientalis TaxID=649198 RepID=A0AAE3VS24_9HYPH|nr:hypothetical protein [Amorphus orientalis]MDQ0317724.1 hypothetical protein [Amorphus orientalis]